MRRAFPALTLLMALAVSLTACRQRSGTAVPEAAVNPPRGPELSPICPWREPARDLPGLFPPGTNYTLETRILSGWTAEICRRLGRSMNPDENPLRIYRVDGPAPGSVLVTRVKGEHGGIEIVLGVRRDGNVQGLLIQSQREPEAVARVITDRAFLSSFAGRNGTSPLRVGEDLPDVVAAARASAQAIADGVRSQLIVLSFAERSPEARELEGQPSH